MLLRALSDKLAASGFSFASLFHPRICFLHNGECPSAGHQPKTFKHTINSLVDKKHQDDALQHGVRRP